MPHSRLFLLGLSLVILMTTSCTTTPSGNDQNQNRLSASESDPYLWLEGIESEKALSWVKERNAKSLGRLEKDPRFKNIEKEARQILLAEDRLPSPEIVDGWVYNFWQDKTHVKGIWRRARPSEYQKKSPRWELILDLDQLAKEESENWVWKGSANLPSQTNRWLIFLSRGGKDATTVREFDSDKKAFLKDGFTLPEAKTEVAWKDKDTLWVGTDFGPGSLTLSGYARITKLWKRGTPLSKAKTIYEGSEKDVAVTGTTYFRPEGVTNIVVKAKTFFEAEKWIFSDEKGLAKIPLPDDAPVDGVFKKRIFSMLRSDWKIGDRTIAAGSLVLIPVDKVTELKANDVEVLFTPEAKINLLGVATAKDYLVLQLLDNVKGKLVKAEPSEKGWQKETIALPGEGQAQILSAYAFDNLMYAEYQGFTTPPSIYAFDPPAKPKLIRQLPKRYNAKGLVVEQFEAKSADGTAVPYFVVHKKGMKKDGKAPTLLYGYGGFEVPVLPYYLEVTGKIWLEKGGTYVVANIRGGGEFGPKWHKAALKENRQRSFDDFEAVAEDLINKKITSPSKLAIRGGSNGGLLVGTVFTQRPELFKAVLCLVPLLDMSRYHKLLAGHSWVSEYGDPEDPKYRDIILKYSPYQNLKKEKKYPDVFILTSTKDDRVHPGHARKMTARMEEQGHSVIYYENIEGGHGAAANLEQRIHNTALEYTFLNQELMD